MADKAAEPEDSGLLNVSELFYSIQGESTFAGYPCFFIRLSGCNLRCSFCDTAYAYEEAGRNYPLHELLRLSSKYPAALIQITGGEPLLQENVYPLMRFLLDGGRRVLLETNGSITIKDVPAGVVKIMDLKCPGSGMSAKMDIGNLKLLSPGDELKFVIGSRTDYDWALDMIGQHYNISSTWSDPSDFPSILFSPETSGLSPLRLAEWILQDQLPVRLQLQMHKILWPGELKGV